MRKGVVTLYIIRRRGRKVYDGIRVVECIHGGLPRPSTCIRGLSRVGFSPAWGIVSRPASWNPSHANLTSKWESRYIKALNSYSKSEIYEMKMNRLRSLVRVSLKKRGLPGLGHPRPQHPSRSSLRSLHIPLLPPAPVTPQERSPPKPPSRPSAPPAAPQSTGPCPAARS